MVSPVCSNEGKLISLSSGLARRGDLGQKLQVYKHSWKREDRSMSFQAPCVDLRLPYANERHLLRNTKNDGKRDDHSGIKAVENIHLDDNSTRVPLSNCRPAGD